MLSLATLPVYLANRGHLSISDWVGGRCTLSSMPGQHDNFLVHAPSNSGLFLKQVRVPTTETIAAIENEARMLAEFEHRDVWDRFRRCVPRLRDYDRSRHLLVIESIEGKNLYDAYHSLSSAGDAAKLSDLPVSVGKWLARFHDAGRQARGDAMNAALTTKLPVAISLQPPDPNFYTALSPACRQTIDWIRADAAFFHGLQSNQAHWQIDTIIHGDLKWNNVMIASGPEAEIKFIDWELARWGDPAWDVAGVLQSFIIHDVERSDSASTNRVANLRSDATALWTSYGQHSQSKQDESWSDRVRRCCAARLVQSVLEREHASLTLSASSAHLLATSRQIQLAPQDALQTILETVIS